MLRRSRKRSATSSPRDICNWRKWCRMAARRLFDAFDEHYALFMIDLAQPDFHNFAAARLYGAAHETSFDRKFAMSSINQHDHPHAAGTAKIEETVHGCPRCASRVEDVVHQKHVLIVHGKWYLARVQHRL